MTRAARAVSKEESGHPALRPHNCIQCFSSKAGGISCSKCSRAAYEEHKALARIISRLRGAPCNYCAAESVGVIVFAGNHVVAFCEADARSYRSLDFVPQHGYVNYGSLPHLVGEKR
jgi:hypothetical protein